MDGVVVGNCGWRGAPDADGSVEIGYLLVPAARRRGYGTEAVAAVIAESLRNEGVRKITAVVEVSNVASRRLLTRLGFQVTGSAPPDVRYALDVGVSPLTDRPAVR